MINIPRLGINVQKVSFKGHTKKQDDTGFDVHRFYYMYDHRKYSCDVEIYNIAKDNNKNITVSKKPVGIIPMKDAPYAELGRYDFYNLNDDVGFAYRFKLTDKFTDEISYAFDNGLVAGIFNEEPGNQYNIVLNNRASINKNGPMQLIIPDTYYPGVKRNNINGSLYVSNSLREKACHTVRTHANRFGGGFIGIIKKLQDGTFKNEGIGRIIGTPFTKDSISSHLYWTENAYQVAPALGNENDFKQLQTELFKNGINWIADAALINEGYCGIHMNELYRKGQESIFKNMFKVESDTISLGILPDNASENNNTSMKIINAPFSLSKDGVYNPLNPDYNPNKPTYIQFFDNRLASNSQKISGTSYDTRSISERNQAQTPPFDLTTYAKNNSDNIYDITRHYDAVYPFYIEVSPTELEKNVLKYYKQNGKINLSDEKTIKEIASFSNFRVENKSKAGGLEFWSGNVEIAKLNFFRSDKDNYKLKSLSHDAVKDFDNGALAVREYAINSAKYWTQLTSDILLEYASRNVGASNSTTAEEYLSAIKKGVDEGILPPNTLKAVNKDIIQNVLDGNYISNKLDYSDVRDNINPEDKYNHYGISDYILKKSMDIPFETLPVATNLLGILTSPYISKKPYTDSEIGVSRYDTYKAGNPNLPPKYSDVYNKTESFYLNTITPLIENIISVVPDIKNEDGSISDYGKYVISEALSDLFKYIVIKALTNNAKIKINNDGTIDFSSVNSEDITMQSLGITYNGMTSQEEAQTVLDALQKGITDAQRNGFYDELKEAVIKRFENRNLNDFKIAEMITDRTESGLGWRIDAAKDVVSVESDYAGENTVTFAWDKTIELWKLFNQSILKINPHAYTTVELTDLFEMFYNEGLKSKYTDDCDAERKFLQETGITSLVNYNYFFALPTSIFKPDSLEDGNLIDSWMTKENKNLQLRRNLDQGWDNGKRITNPGFLFESPDDGVTNSYTFIDNHDRVRILHGLALDMTLFNSDFAKDKVSLYAKDGEKFKTHRAIAFEVLQIPENQLDFDKVSPQAIAMGQRLNEAFDYAIEAIYKDYNLSKELSHTDKEKFKKALKDSVSMLACGNYLNRNSDNGNPFRAKDFGSRPFNIAIKTVLDQEDYLRNQGNTSGYPAISPVIRKKTEAKALEFILKPAFDRYFSIYKLLTVLPGTPTDFAGDRVGATGFETYCKHQYQQNRNIINWEWLNNKDYDFIHNAYSQINSIANLRSNEKLSALNDGATITLPIHNAKNPSDYIQGFLRYNDKGSVVLCFTDNTGAQTPLNQMMKRGKTIAEPKLYLFNNEDNLKQGLKHGITEGLKFKNPLDTQGEIYTVKKDTIGYYLEKTRGGYVLPISIEPKDLNTLVLYKV